MEQRCCLSSECAGTRILKSSVHISGSYSRFEMGLRSFSMSPAIVPSIKDFARHMPTKRAENILVQTLRLKTVAHIKCYVHDQTTEIDPSVALLDTT